MLVSLDPPCDFPRLLRCSLFATPFARDVWENIPTLIFTAAVNIQL